MKRKLQRKRGARKALLKNLATSLILHEKISTTLPKAKEVRSLVERLIQKGKKGDLTARRYLLKFLPKNVVAKVIEDLAPHFSNRQSGYIRILHLGPRSGDGAKMALISFVERAKKEKIEEPKEQKKVKKAEKVKKPKTVKKETKKQNETKSRSIKKS